MTNQLRPPAREAVRYYRWERWVRGHGEFKPFGPANLQHRPVSLWPVGRVPGWAHDLLKRRLAASARPSPPVITPTPWDGVGAFTAWDPRAVLRFASLVDYAVCQCDGYAEDGSPWLTPQLVSDLEHAVKNVYYWCSWDRELVNPDLPPRPLVGQAEGAGQLLRSEAAAVEAIITNVYMDSWPAELKFGFVETYTNVVAANTPLRMLGEALHRGAPRVSLTFGAYDGSSEAAGGRKVSLGEYLVMAGAVLRDPHVVGFSVYLAEHLDARDIQDLKDWRARG